MRNIHLVISFVCILIFSSCADKYQAYKTLYQFKSADGKADYSKLDYWAAHPWKWDPSDSIPTALQPAIRDSAVDVFFMHPTTHTKRKKKWQDNAAIDNEYINAKTDYSTILYQASVFNQDARVFAPRYRQAHLSSFYQTDKQRAAAEFDLAYNDLRTAFLYYLENWNNGRPIIIASHSQGSLLAERLLKEFFENKPLQNRLVVAYIPGWAVPKDYFTSLKMCADSFQTGCICSWRTVRKGFIPRYIRSENGNSFVTNPLNWTTGDTYAPRALNKGSVLRNFNSVYKKTTDAQIRNGLLHVKKPKFPGSFLYFRRNYHIGDINLFYLNIREDIHRRIGLFWKK